MPQERKYGRELLPKCNARLKSGSLCKNAAGLRTTHTGFGRCYRHAGSTDAGNKAAAREQAEAAAAVQQAFYGPDVKISPNEALMGELYRTNAFVSWLRNLISVTYGMHPDDYVGGDIRENARMMLLHVSDDLKHEAAAYIKLWQEERGHLVRCALACKALGVMDEQIKLIEMQADIVAFGIAGFVADLRCDINEPYVRQAIQNFLNAITERAQSESARVEGALVTARQLTSGA